MEKIFSKEICEVLNIDYLTIASRLSLDIDDTDQMDELKSLISQAISIARPKVIIKLFDINVLDDKQVMMGGEIFTSKILSSKMKTAKTAYGFIATSGPELDVWSDTMSDPLQAYYADTIKVDIVSFAVKFLKDYMVNMVNGFVGVISPGSSRDWPISEQLVLFNAIGDVEGKIGVTLSDSYLMVPTKSISGMYFTADKEYEDCEFCENDNCPTRKKPFSQSMSEDFFIEE